MREDNNECLIHYQMTLASTSSMCSAYKDICC